MGPAMYAKIVPFVETHLQLDSITITVIKLSISHFVLNTIRSVSRSMVVKDAHPQTACLCLSLWRET
jgi:hypothetical protein